MRQRFWPLAIAGVIGLISAACGGGASAPSPAASPAAQASATPSGLTQDVNMKQNIGPLAYYAPLHVGVQQGFFKANHINMSLVDLPAGSLDAPAILNGDIEVGDVGFNDIASLKAQGKDLIAIYDLQNRVTLDFVVANKFLKDHNLSPTMPLADKFKGLKGMRIGISSPGAPTDLFARYYVRQAGLDPDKDVQIIRIGSIAGLLAALRSDQIDGYMLSAPSPQQVEQQGLGQILIKSSAGEVPQLANFYYTVFAMRADYIQKNPAIVMAYVKAIQQAAERVEPAPIRSACNAGWLSPAPTSRSAGDAACRSAPRRARRPSSRRVRSATPRSTRARVDSRRWSPRPASASRACSRSSSRS